MSAEVLGSVAPVRSESVTPGAARPVSAALLEPSLVTRLLAVAVAVFAVPVLLELYALVAGSGAPGTAVLGGAFVAAGLMAAGFGGLLRAAPRAPELRAGRVLCAALGAEVASLAAALLSRIV
jgi:hypothetical protein